MLLSILKAKAIAEVSQTKFLGVYIDSSKWKKHINCIAGKLSRGIGLVAKAHKLLNSDALITLYYSFIYHYLVYCNHVWRSTYLSNLQKLIILQKRIIRIIMGAKPRDHTEPMFLKLGSCYRMFPPAIDIIPTSLAVAYSIGKYTN